MTLKIVHLELKEANALVEQWHRHHKRVIQHRFSIGVEDDGKLVGAAIIGRPVARGIDWHKVVEVTRLVTDGTKNACSILYAASARAARELGYERIQTYILASEPGTSLKAAGWIKDKDVKGRSWDTPSRRRKDNHPTVDKERWIKDLQ